MTYFLLLGWTLLAASLVGLLRLWLPSRGSSLPDAALRSLGLIGGVCLVPALLAWAIFLEVHPDEALPGIAFLPFAWFATIGGGTAMVATSIVGLNPFGDERGGIVWALFITVQVAVTLVLLANGFRKSSYGSRTIPAVAKGMAFATFGNAVLGLCLLIPLAANG